MANTCKQIFLASLFFTGMFSATAQNNQVLKFKAEYFPGIVLNEKGSCSGFEAALELPMYGNHNWDYAFNFPTVGFALGAFRLSNLDYLNPVIYFNPYFHYPIINKYFFILNAKFGAGLALTGTGDYDTGYIFPLTGVATGGINVEIALAKKYGNPLAQWSFISGLNGIILHNGNITRKSKNLAAATLSIGMKYTPDVYPLPIKYPPKPIEQLLVMEVCGQGGINQLSREDGDRYFPNASLNLGFYYNFSNVYRLGAGGDVFFNSSNIQNKIRGGLFLANDLTIDKLILGIHTGFYVYPKTKDKMYNKFVLKYKISEFFMINAQFKSHLHRAECFEIGIGAAIPDIGTFITYPFKNISFKKEDRNEVKID